MIDAHRRLAADARRQHRATASAARRSARSLAYYDSYRRDRLPGNLIQAQRDYFGAHTYERTDKPGTFHMEWKEGGSEILQVEGKSRTK